MSPLLLAAVSGPLTVDALLTRALTAEARLRDAEDRLRHIAILAAALADRGASVDPAAVPAPGDSVDWGRYAGSHRQIAVTLYADIQRYAARLREVAT